MLHNPGLSSKEDAMADFSDALTETHRIQARAAH
jgi:hypothetical protein